MNDFDVVTGPAPAKPKAPAAPALREPAERERAAPAVLPPPCGVKPEQTEETVRHVSGP
jgi:hypothetical protein